jgi:hypothetical protein
MIPEFRLVRCSTRSTLTARRSTDAAKESSRHPVRDAAPVQPAAAGLREAAARRPDKVAHRSTIAGESLSEPYADSPYSFVVSADMTKSRRDDVGIAA